MSWNKLPDDLINLILSTRREILRVDACKIVLDRAYAITEGLKEAYKRAHERRHERAGVWSTERREFPCPTLTPELATTMEWAVEVVSGKESSKLWHYTFNMIEYLLWQNRYTEGGGKYYNRIDAAYITLIERFGWVRRTGWGAQLEQHVEF